MCNTVSKSFQFARVSGLCKWQIVPQNDKSFCMMILIKQYLDSTSTGLKNPISDFIFVIKIKHFNGEAS